MIKLRLDIIPSRVYKKRTNKVLRLVFYIMTHSSAFLPTSLSAPIMVGADTSGVKCNGGNAALGHPEVYYSFDNGTEVTCGYCGQVFSKTI
jgi:uncharacterized Zn-finger protein